MENKEERTVSSFLLKVRDDFLYLYDSGLECGIVSAVSAWQYAGHFFDILMSVSSYRRGDWS